MEETNNTNNSKVVLLTLVFVLLAVGLWSFFGGNPLNLLEKKQDNKKDSPKVETLSVDKDIATLEGVANFPNLTVKSSVALNYTEIEKDLSLLVLADATSKQLSRDIFSDGNKGWSMSYQYAENVMNVYNKLYSTTRDGGYKINKSSRTFSAAIITAENQKYEVKILAQYLDDKNSLVRVTVLENK